MTPYDQDFSPKPRRSPWWAFIGYWSAVLAMFSLLVLILWLVSGCSTVVPKPVDAEQASFDGGERNSGLLALFADGSAKITPNARNRYNALVELYGRDFLPHLSRDAGVTPLPDGNFQIDGQRLVDFDLMNRKYRAGIAPRP